MTMCLPPTRLFVIFHVWPLHQQGSTLSIETFDFSAITWSRTSPIAGARGMSTYKQQQQPQDTGEKNFKRWT